MNAKLDRLKNLRIIFLSNVATPLSITELHDKLFEKFHIDVARKTIQRDIKELLDDGIIMAVLSSPRKYKLEETLKMAINLTQEEVSFLNDLLNDITDPLRKRTLERILKKVLS